MARTQVEERKGMRNQAKSSGGEAANVEIREGRMSIRNEMVQPARVSPVRIQEGNQRGRAKRFHGFYDTGRKVPNGSTCLPEISARQRRANLQGNVRADHGGSAQVDR